MVSHLLFADDMLVFCKGYEKLAKGVNDASQKLEQYTGLAINKQKSKVFLSKGCMKLLLSWVYLLVVFL